MLKIGILGATGYTGEELIGILLKHRSARIMYLGTRVERNASVDEIFPQFKGRLSAPCEESNFAHVAASCDLVFLALPHTQSMAWVPKLLKASKKVIDLSADYRLKNTATYEQFYKLPHTDKDNIKRAVYGLPELYRQDIKRASFVANPGCYPTAAILGLAPVLVSGIADAETIIIDAKSGASGAGKKAAEELMFCEVNENFKAYKVNAHQHMPEIEQELSKVAGKKITINFVPHLLPLHRGILETIYVKVKKISSAKDILEMYKRFYKKEPFVRVCSEGKVPQLKDVACTNFCDIGVVYDKEKKMLVIISAIDNLQKGAAGQAVQNMNIMYGFPEAEGLA